MSDSDNISTIAGEACFKCAICGDETRKRIEEQIERWCLENQSSEKFIRYRFGNKLRLLKCDRCQSESIASIGDSRLSDDQWACIFPPFFTLTLIWFRFIENDPDEQSFYSLLGNNFRYLLGIVSIAATFFWLANNERRFPVIVSNARIKSSFFYTKFRRAKRLRKLAYLLLLATGITLNLDVFLHPSSERIYNKYCSPSAVTKGSTVKIFFKADIVSADKVWRADLKAQLINSSEFDPPLELNFKTLDTPLDLLSKPRNNAPQKTPVYAEVIIPDREDLINQSLILKFDFQIFYYATNRDSSYLANKLFSEQRVINIVSEDLARSYYFVTIGQAIVGSLFIFLTSSLVFWSDSILKKIEYPTALKIVGVSKTDTRL